MDRASTSSSGNPGGPLHPQALLARRRLRFALRELLLVAAGAVPGALLRWQVSVQLGGHAGADLLVNLLGSFLLGVLAGPIPHRTTLMLCLGIGFCGCLTTFSSWMLDVMRLLQAQQPWQALGLVATSLVLGLACAALGLAFSRWLPASGLARMLRGERGA